MVHLRGRNFGRSALCISTLVSSCRYGTSLLSGFAVGGLYQRAPSCSCYPKLLSCGVGDVGTLSRLGILRGGAKDAEAFVAASSNELQDGSNDSGAGIEVSDTDAADTKKKERWLLGMSEHDR